jgi:hypothetical protein
MHCTGYLKISVSGYLAFLFAALSARWLSLLAHIIMTELSTDGIVPFPTYQSNSLRSSD